jgi:hypothetical protein
MRLYYKTLHSNVYSLIYNKQESIYALKPIIYKNLDTNLLENYKFKYIGEILNDGTLIDNGIFYNTFSEGVNKYKCTNTIFCASQSQYRSFRRNL